MRRPGSTLVSRGGTDAFRYQHDGFWVQTKCPDAQLEGLVERTGCGGFSLVQSLSQAGVSW